MTQLRTSELNVASLIEESLHDLYLEGKRLLCIERHLRATFSKHRAFGGRS